MGTTNRRVLFYISGLFCLIAALLGVLGGCSATEEVSYDYEAFEFADYTAYAIKGVRNAGDVLEIPTEHDGWPVTHILDGAFHGCNMRELHMETVIDIYDKAFVNCLYLASIDFGVIERIGKLAFRNCTALKSITVPKTATTIGTEAFLGCTGLETVYFEGTPESIGNHAFEPGVTLYGPAGSSVEEYAKSSGLEFVSWDPDAGQ